MRETRTWKTKRCQPVPTTQTVLVVEVVAMAGDVAVVEVEEGKIVLPELVAMAEAVERTGGVWRPRITVTS